MPVPNLASYKVSSGDEVDSEKFNNLVDAVQASLAGVGDPALTTFGSGQILLPSKIKQEGATLNQGLVWDGTKWAPAGISAQTLYRKNSATDVATGVETDILGGGITVGANLMSTNGWIRAEILADVLYNRNTADTCQLRVSLGGVDLFRSTAAQSTAFPAGALYGTTLSAIRRPVRIYLDFQMQGANLVVLNGVVIPDTSAVAPTTGIGGNTTVGTTFGSAGAISVDTTATMPLTVKVLWSTGSASNSYRCQTAQVVVR